MLDPGKKTEPPPAPRLARDGVDEAEQVVEPQRGSPQPSPPEDAFVPSDRALLAAHLANDLQAFNELARRHRLDLWAVALRVLGDRDDADDAVQEALVRAFRGARTYRGEAEVRAWLRAVVENTSRTLARRRDSNGRETVGLPADEGTPRSQRGPEEQVLHFAEAEELLSRIPLAFRRTFILVKVRGFSYAEAAAIEAVSVGTIRSRIGRAKAALAADDHGRTGPEPGGRPASA